MSVLYESVSLSAGDVDASSSGIGIGIRQYYDGTLFEGTYINYFLLSGSAEASDNFDSVGLDAISLGVTYGKIWTNGNVNFDASIGGRYITTSYDFSNPSLDTSSIEELEGFGLSITLGVGVYF